MLECPACRCPESSVTDTRNDRTKEKFLFRRRECLSCGHRFSTHEVLAPGSTLQVMRSDGKYEPYNRQILLDSLLRATEKRPLTSAKVEKIVVELEATLFSKREPVTKEAIGLFVMKRLKALDPHVSYVRYASVFKEFTTADEFLRLLRSIIPLRQSVRKAGEQ